mgnify:CR=1 FL=1
MKQERDEAREHRITYEIIVDCYDGYEQAMGWWCYLDDTIQFPFKAKCITERSRSPLNIGETIKVIGMADEEDCEREMFVIIEFMKREFAVPLMQLKPMNTDEATTQAVEDWQYWVNQGYSF